MSEVTVIRRARFNAAHRLYNPDWDMDTNDRVFGKCNNPNFHGHNYEMFVSITGQVNPETGFVYDLLDLGKIIDRQVIERFDHKNLNLDTKEFSNLNPTVENIAVVIWNLLREEISEEYGLSVKVHETENNFAEYNGDDHE